MDKLAYEIGVQLAMADTGLIPMEKVAIVPEIIGGIAAPEGEGWRGASGAGLGSLLGGLGGTLGGGLLGAGVGAGLGALGGNAGAGAAAGAPIGGLLGGLGGGIYGGVKGYRAAIMDEDKKRELLKKMLADQKLKNELLASEG